MKIYNVGSEVFTFIHGGTTFVLLPKEGTFERQKEFYDVETTSAKGNVHKMKRFIEVWKKVSDEGTNNNFVDLPAAEFVSACFKKAEKEGYSNFLKRESEIIKLEQDRVAAIEKRAKLLEKELEEKEHEMRVKLATLERVEKEAFSKTASSFKK
jgi:hypothetical protein